MAFKPGVSGNLKGRPKGKSMRKLAQIHTANALAVLDEIMRSPTASAKDRLMAANSILDRGWGKPVPEIEYTSAQIKSMSDVELLRLIDGK